MVKIYAWNIQIHGRIQGVGFRPLVRRLAEQQSISGQVKNNNNGLTIIVDATADKVNHFIESLQSEKPERSIITGIQVDKSAAIGFSSFDITESGSDDVGNIFISPDYAICSICRSDTRDAHNRRYQYGFTTCLNCGPRYSIQAAIPYDRNHTTMKNMSMCTACKTEYHKTDNRRAHSQTNSCPSCKIPIHLYQNGNEVNGTETELFNKVVDALQNDGIVAIKGLGGYYLCCNAVSEKAIQKLRIRKHRPAKPLAVMYDGIDSIQLNYDLSSKEKEMLCSSIAPIVLLKPLRHHLPEIVAPGLSKVGVLLPSTPLLQIILDQCGFPIISTSGNITNEPIHYKDDEAIDALKKISDATLTYDRDIIMPQDDCVIQYSPKHQQKIIIRRARGMAPEYIGGHAISSQNVYAFGADMKNTLTIQSRNNIYISQYLGDCSNYDTQTRINYIREYFLKLLKEPPEILLADAHPGYESSRLAQEWGSVLPADITYIQHHRAHFAAILEVHDLWTKGEKVLGVIWDGTGYGDDDNMWGGEFFEWTTKDLKRVGHIDYTPIIAGDKMAQEPRLSALSYCYDIDELQSLLIDKFTSSEWRIYSRLGKTENAKTSSVGRLFDAVASILGVCDINQYEGHAALLLENLALQYQPSENESAYDIKIDVNQVLDSKTIFKGIYNDLNMYKPKPLIAYRFHLTLVRIIEQIAINNSMTEICFSGGVFQNGLLVDLIIDKFKEPFQIYFHKDMSPNDENISFGQLAYFNHLIADTDE